LFRLPEDPTLEEISQAGGVPDLHAEAHVVSDGQVWVSGEIERKTAWESGLIGGCQWINGKWENEPGQVELQILSH
jgi:7,8-dihydropterin-6-yl-methyl-4-(beta-D-ribofuranosyl)aminobenzene 5'-phosphate synthase